jgi:hypothetical protein
MELFNRPPQAVKNHPSLHLSGDVCWFGLRTFLLWAAVTFLIVACLLAFRSLNQSSAIETALRTSGILIRCFYRLSVDGEEILSEVLAGWHSINASLEWVS